MMNESSLTFAGRALAAAAIAGGAGGMILFPSWLTQHLPGFPLPLPLVAVLVLIATAGLTGLCASIMGRMGIAIRTSAPETRPDSDSMVPYFDPEAGQTVRIPAAELRPGTVQVLLNLGDGKQPQLVWILAEHLHEGDLEHTPFDEEVRRHIERIRQAFEEHRPISLEQWEDGFRRDREPFQEIALWLHAADIYDKHGRNDSSAQRREEVYRCIVACLTTTSDGIWRVYRPERLSRQEAEEIVQTYFGGLGRFLRHLE